MAFYVKATKEVADYLGVTDIRNRTADGNVLLWQADLNRIPGETIFERAQSVGGVCLQPAQAKAEIEGADGPAEVHTPDAYRIQSVEVKDNETPSETEGEEGGTV